MVETRILRHAGASWVVGLWWQTLPSSKRLNSEARQHIRSMLDQSYDEDEPKGGLFEELNCFVPHVQGVPQAGYGNLPQRVVPLPSLGAAVLQGKKGTWMGRFILSGGFWVIVVVNDTIHPDGDFFTESLEEAEERFNALRDAADDWDEIYIAESEEASCSELEKILVEISLRQVPKLTTLRFQIPVGTILKVLAATSAIYMAWFWTSWYLEAREEKIREANILVARKQLEEQKAREEEESLRTLNSAWRNLPSPEVLFRSCFDDFASQPVIKEGWALKTWKCTPGGIQTVWAKTDYGNFIHLPPGSKLDLENPFEAVKTTFIQQSRHRVTEELAEFEQSLPWVYEAARLTGLSLKVKRPEKSESSDKPYKKIEWILGDFEIFPSLSLGRRFEAIPALAVDEIKWEKQSWTVKGVLYGRNGEKGD